jgi:acetyltransferase-like isoleucine patch superfamily enzyme
MKPVLVPTTDVNSETGVLLSWMAADRSEVAEGDALAEIETSKAIIDVPCPASGYLLHLAREGAEVSLREPVARVFPDLAALEAFAGEDARRRAEAAESGPRASAPARKRAQELGVDLSTLAGSGLITVGMVETAAAAAATVDVELPQPLAGVDGLPRIALIGAGLGAMQVIDILNASGSGAAVAIVDDDPARWAEEIMGVPVVGGFSHLTELFAAGGADAAIIAVGTSVPARVRLREALTEVGIPLANAIDPTARICADVEFGAGNIVCANCHFGVATIVGDNNFISAYNSFDHHSRIGNDIATGPSNATSGLVVIGDRVRMGTGIFIEPHVELGDDVIVASGSVIVASVPANHAVKRRVVTTSVVPRR